jgi:hypothetical protein
MSDNRDEKIRAALAELSDADNAVWTSDGQPLISAVQQRAGIGVSREDLQKFGRIRKSASPADEVADDIDDPAPAATEADALAAVEECARQFFAARTVEDAAAIRLKKANKVLGDAFVDYMNGTPKREATDVLRENVARDIARKLAIKAGEIKSDEAQPPQFQSAIDAQAYYSKGGKAGAKYGAFRRLPSQR